MKARASQNVYEIDGTDADIEAVRARVAEERLAAAARTRQRRRSAEPAGRASPDRRAHRALPAAEKAAKAQVRARQKLEREQELDTARLLRDDRRRRRLDEQEGLLSYRFVADMAEKARIRMPRQAGETGVALCHLFSSVLAAQLPGTLSPDVRTSDGYSTIWLPPIKLAITSMEPSSPVAALERSRAAEMLRIDILTLDLSRPGGLVECELDLFASRRTHGLAVQNLALWISPLNVVALVPCRNRDMFDPLPPSFALTAVGPELAEDPFRDQSEWIAGIDRAIEVAGEALAAQKMASTNVAGATR